MSEHPHRAAGYRSEPAFDPGVFALADADYADPLPTPSRVGLVWDGQEWAEIDPETGEILATGSIGPVAGGQPKGQQKDLP